MNYLDLDVYGRLIINIFQIEIYAGPWKFVVNGECYCIPKTDTVKMYYKFKLNYFNGGLLFININMNNSN